MNTRTKRSECADYEKLIRQVNPDLVVASGPFKGLKFTSLEFTGSMVAPKLVGSYEAELHAVIEEICGGDYGLIVNIGCGEGYYAVGLALRNRKAKVYAIDVDSKARERCSEMARANSVLDRITVLEHFDMDRIDNCFSNGARLIICDCEGHEREIFRRDGPHWARFADYDMLVEAHEFIHPGITETLLNSFAETHEVHIIMSVGDALRPRRYWRGPPDVAMADRLTLMAENRPSAMEWLFMKKKVSGRELTF